MGVVITVAGGVTVLLAATVAFDVVHVTLHRLQDARAPWLRAVGEWHGIHHRFLGTDLVVDRSLIAANLRWHVLPEYATHVVFTSALLPLVPAGVVVVALAIETLVVAVILRDRGLDVNHRPRTHVPAYRPGLVCVPAYHALHHVWPTGFYSSWIKVLDRALGSATALGGRTAAVVGPAGDLAPALARALAAETGRPAPVVEPTTPAARAAAENADLLVLVAPDDAGADELTAWVESAIEASSERLVPIETWVLPPAPAAFAAEGRGYVDDARVLYRHVIVPRPLPADADSVARAIVRAARRGQHRIHLGPPSMRARDWLRAWRGVRPTRRGPRAAALA